MSRFEMGLGTSTVIISSENTGLGMRMVSPPFPFLALL